MAASKPIEKCAVIIQYIGFTIYIHGDMIWTRQNWKLVDNGLSKK